MRQAQCIEDFLRATFERTQKTRAVIAVSGGIDSAVALTLATRALGSNAVTALLLPYGDQDMADARLICEWNKLSASAIRTHDISPVVSEFEKSLKLSEEAEFRRGNVMARVRMIHVFDVAKELDALVIGTENKSEHYLGYFTRFGDGASDIEPLIGLTKTQVRELAQTLSLPKVFLQKAPSAGLWSGQTDEAELGFSYEVADQVIAQYVDQGLLPKEIRIPGLDFEVVQAVCDRIDSQAFKRQVPYLPPNA